MIITIRSLKKSFCVLEFYNFLFRIQKSDEKFKRHEF